MRTPPGTACERADRREAQRAKVAVRSEQRKRLELLRDQARKRATQKNSKTDTHYAERADAERYAKELAESPPLSIPRLLGDDHTPESLVKLLARNAGRIAIATDEGGPFQAMAGRYTVDPNIDVYLKAWEGTSPIVVDRWASRQQRRQTRLSTPTSSSMGMLNTSGAIHTTPVCPTPGPRAGTTRATSR